MHLFQNMLGRTRSPKTGGTHALRHSGRRLQIESLEGRDLFTVVPLAIINDMTINSAKDLAYPDKEVIMGAYAQRQEDGAFFFDANGTPYLASNYNGQDVHPFMMSQMPLDSNHNHVLNLVDTMPGSQFRPIGGRLYFSMDTPPVLPIIAGKVVAMAPGPEYFDYIEFTINGPNSAGTAGLQNLNIDTTSVDQFGIPIKVKVDSSELSGGSDTVGINLDRGKVLAAFNTYTSDAGNPYAICLTAQGSGTYGKYRILNPSGLFKNADVQLTPLLVQTTLQVTVNPTITTINVYDADSFPDPATQGPFNIKIENEEMTVTSASKGLGTSTNWVVTRGVNGTTAVAHTAPKLVNIVNPAMSATTTKLTMPNTTGYPQDPAATPFYVQVGSEIMKVTAAVQAGADQKINWTVLRGQLGTTATTHDNNTPVYYNSSRDLALNSIFNSAVDVFFDTYLSTKPSPQTLTLVSNKDHHIYKGTVVHSDEPLANTGPMVLRFKDQTDTANSDPIDVYYPFFTNNNYFYAPYHPLLPVAAAPADLIAANVENMSPSYMVFGCLGVFGDSGERALLNATQQGVLGDLENQVVAALNRGVAMIPNTDGTAWEQTSLYYGKGGNPTAQPYNHYAAFLHETSPEISIDGLNYGFAYDDNNHQASDIAVGTLSTITSLSATLTPWATHAVVPDPPGPPNPPTPSGVVSMRDFMTTRLPYSPPQGAEEQSSTFSAPDANPQAAVDEALSDLSSTDDLAWLQALDQQNDAPDEATNSGQGFSMRSLIGSKIG